MSLYKTSLLDLFDNELIIENIQILDLYDNELIIENIELIKLR